MKDASMSLGIYFEIIDLMTSLGESTRILITKECAAITKAKQLR